MNWKPIENYEGLYEVSDTGLVRSLWHGKKKILSPRKMGGGYSTVHLCKEGKAKNMLVHRLVATAFIPNPLGLPTVNHKDENKLNNHVENLEWLSVADNNRYSKDRPILQFDRLGNLVGQFPSLKEAERQTGISDGNISSACSGRRKTAGGFSWKYA